MSRIRVKGFEAQPNVNSNPIPVKSLLKRNVETLSSEEKKLTESVSKNAEESLGEQKKSFKDVGMEKLLLEEATARAESDIDRATLKVESAIDQAPTKFDRLKDYQINRVPRDTSPRRVLKSEDIKRDSLRRESSLKKEPVFEQFDEFPGLEKMKSSGREKVLSDRLSFEKRKEAVLGRALASEKEKEQSLEKDLMLEKMRAKSLGRALVSEKEKEKDLSKDLMFEKMREKEKERGLMLEKLKSMSLERDLASEQQRERKLGRALSLEKEKEKDLTKDLMMERLKSKSLEKDLSSEQKRERILGRALASEHKKEKTLEKELESEHKKEKTLEMENKALLKISKKALDTAAREHREKEEAEFESFVAESQLAKLTSRPRPRAVSPEPVLRAMERQKARALTPVEKARPHVSHRSLSPRAPERIRDYNCKPELHHEYSRKESVFRDSLMRIYKDLRDTLEASIRNKDYSTASDILEMVPSLRDHIGEAKYSEIRKRYRHPTFLESFNEV